MEKTRRRRGHSREMVRIAVGRPNTRRRLRNRDPASRAGPRMVRRARPMAVHETRMIGADPDIPRTRVRRPDPNSDVGEVLRIQLGRLHLRRQRKFQRPFSDALHKASSGRPGKGRHTRRKSPQLDVLRTWCLPELLPRRHLERLLLLQETLS